MNYQSSLLKKLNQKAATIGIIGLGYVGLPLAVRFAESGLKVIGFDIDPDKIHRLNNNQSYIQGISHTRLKAIHEQLTASSDFSLISQCDAIIICVPTPLTAYREPDLSFISSTMESILPYITQGQIISLESTTYPGTTEEYIIPAVEKKGLTVGEDIFIIYSPEREDPGNEHFTTQTIPKICGGQTALCLELGIALYKQAVEQVVPVSNLKTAEMTKLLENIYRAVNIGLVNEMKIVADKMGIDIHEVIDAAATKPFGYTPFYPGPGLGGHCIPIDPFYLTWKAKEVGINTRFIELAGEVNRNMPQWVLGKITEGLNSQRKPLNGSKILVLGLAYKKDVNDPRESPAAYLMQLLSTTGAIVSYSDPHIPEFPKMRDFKYELKSTPITVETIISYDCIVIMTDHSKIDYPLIQNHAALIVDSRRVYRDSFENVTRA